jgi:ribosomal protein L37AE/L43A
MTHEHDPDDNEQYPGEQPAERASDSIDARERVVACPFCHSTEVELLSLFGSQLSTDQWYCQQCHTPFERFRHDGE